MEEAPPPIFVLGILPRSGTNFLSDLLCVHPDCAPVAPLHEDFLVAHSDLLARYAATVGGRWNPAWGVDGLEGELFAGLGRGLAAFLAARADGRRAVAKTPRVDGLERFPELFPGAPLLILVRDGRAVVESGVRSFGWYPDSARHRWAAAARRIRAFDAAHRGGGTPYRIVRYEELLEDLEGTLLPCLELAGLDAARYDFDRARSLPVRGSSAVAAEGGVHWKPVDRDAGFAPGARFAHWKRADHERFRWVAGDELAALGYEADARATGGAAWALWNLVLDMRWAVAARVGPLVRGR